MSVAFTIRAVLLMTVMVRHEALVRREALGVEGGGRPSRRVVAAARSKRSAA